MEFRIWSLLFWITILLWFIISLLCPIPPFWDFILYSVIFIMEICNFLFFLFHRGLTVKHCPEFQKRLNFGIKNVLRMWYIMGTFLAGLSVFWMVKWSWKYRGSDGKWHLEWDDSLIFTNIWYVVPSFMILFGLV